MRAFELFLILPAACARTAGPSHLPSHLVVLAHGLSGTSRDLLRLETALALDSSILALSVRGNEGRTKDGITKGSARIVDEVRVAVAANPCLRRISFVGNSLGGLYVRAAACQLLEVSRLRLGNDLIAGLAPEVLVTIASPHLGTRLLPWCPPFLHPVAPLFVGVTASDLFLTTPLLVEMTDERHLRALRAFRRRVLYANSAGDLMVQPHTASINGAHRGLEPRERLMASRLRSMPWRTVLVQFSWLLLPIAHNMICALSRNSFTSALYRRGGTVIDDVAATISASARQPVQAASSSETFHVQ